MDKLPDVGVILILLTTSIIQTCSGEASGCRGPIITYAQSGCVYLNISDMAHRDSLVFHLQGSRLLSVGLAQTSDVLAPARMLWFGRSENKMMELASFKSCGIVGNSPYEGIQVHAQYISSQELVSQAEFRAYWLQWRDDKIVAGNGTTIGSPPVLNFTFPDAMPIAAAFLAGYGGNIFQAWFEAPFVGFNCGGEEDKDERNTQPASSTPGSIPLRSGGQTPPAFNYTTVDETTFISYQTTEHITVSETNRPNVEPVNETTKPNVEPVSETTKPNVEPVSETTKPNVEPVSETTKPNVEPVSETTKPNVESVSETTKPNVEPVSETTKPNVESVSETTKPNVEPVSETTKPNVKPVSETTKPNVESVSETTKPNVEPVSETTKPNVEPVSETTKPNVKPVSETTKPNVEPVSETTKPNVEPVSETTKPNVEPVSETTKPNVKPVSETTKPNVKPVSETTKPNVESVSETTKPNVEPVSETTKPNVEPVSETTKPNVESVSETTKPNVEPVSETTKPNVEPVSETTKPNVEPVSKASEPELSMLTATTEKSHAMTTTETMELSAVNITETREPSLITTTKRQNPLSTVNLSPFPSSPGSLTSAEPGKSLDLLPKCKCIRQSAAVDSSPQSQLARQREKEEAIASIQKSLSLATANLSAQQRKKNSADDERGSTPVVGGLWALLCFSPIILIVLSDLIRAIHHLRQ